MNNKAYRFIFWTPRIFSIIFVVFLALMSLDVFGEGLNFGQTILALFMHNIPALILLAIVIIAWKREIVGAVAFAAAGILYCIFVLYSAITSGFAWYYLAWIVQIAGVAFVIAALYYLGWSKKKAVKTPGEATKQKPSK